MAGLAIDGCDLIRMGIAFDVRMAVVALQAAVNALAEFLAVGGDAVAGGVGHAGLTVAGEAVSLRTKSDGCECQSKNGHADSDDAPEDAETCSLPCGAVHPAVFFPQAEEGFSALFPVSLSRNPMRLLHGSYRRDHSTEKTCLEAVLAVTGITSPAMQITDTGFGRQLAAISGGARSVSFSNDHAA